MRKKHIFFVLLLLYNHTFLFAINIIFNFFFVETNISLYLSLSVFLLLPPSCWIILKCISSKRNPHILQRRKREKERIWKQKPQKFLMPNTMICSADNETYLANEKRRTKWKKKMEQTSKNHKKLNPPPLPPPPKTPRKQTKDQNIQFGNNQLNWEWMKYIFRYC